MSCTTETNVVPFRIGYPTKDDQGNVIDIPEGVQLEVQKPGSTEFVIAGSCDFPQDTILWKMGLDGQYIFRARCYTYAAKGGGNCGNACKRFGPASKNIGVLVKNAAPGSPPSPVQLIGDCCTTGMGAGMASPSLCCA